MKKLMVLVLFFVYTQVTFSSEKGSYELVALPEKGIAITTVEGLRTLALTSSLSWNELSSRYVVDPLVAIDYLEIKDSGVKDKIYWYHANATDFHYKFLIDEIISEMRNTDANKSVLEDMRQQVFATLHTKSVETKREIDEKQSDYENKKKDCLRCALYNTMGGSLIVGGWAVVGLFIWVATHCHQPWG